MLKGADKKRFKTKVKNLKNRAFANDWHLMTRDEAPNDASCVLSDNDLDEGFEPELCDKESESYFLAGKDLLEYLEIE